MSKKKLPEGPRCKEEVRPDGRRVIACSVPSNQEPRKVSYKEECTLCYGYGMWASGSPAPMGPMDAADGMPTVPCPQCGANKNPKSS